MLIPDANKIQKQIENFNSKFKRGDGIILLDDYGNPFVATVTYGAALVGGNTPVIYIEGNKGCYDFRRLVKKK